MRTAPQPSKPWGCGRATGHSHSPLAPRPEPAGVQADQATRRSPTTQARRAPKALETPTGKSPPEGKISEAGLTTERSSASGSDPVPVRGGGGSKCNTGGRQTGLLSHACCPAPARARQQSGSEQKEG